MGKEKNEEKSGKQKQTESSEEGDEDNELEEERESSEDSDCDIDVAVNSSLLDCPLCFEPLHVPFFQCINGHVACSECSAKFGKKCSSCFTPTTSRCLQLESIVESNKVKCPYTKYGCETMESYNKIIPHKGSCMYAPCSCPIPECTYKCQMHMLSTHISRDHRDFSQQKFFIFGRNFTVRLKKKHHMYVFHGRNDVYVLHNRPVELASKLWIARLSSSSGSAEYGYELEVESAEGSLLKMRGMIENVKNLRKQNLPKFFLYVPHELFGSAGELEVKVKMCTRKNKRGR